MALPGTAESHLSISQSCPYLRGLLSAGPLCSAQSCPFPGRPSHTEVSAHLCSGLWLTRPLSGVRVCLCVCVCSCVRLCPEVGGFPGQLWGMRSVLEPLAKSVLLRLFLGRCRVVLSAAGTCPPLGVFLIWLQHCPVSLGLWRCPPAWEVWLRKHSGEGGVCSVSGQFLGPLPRSMGCGHQLSCPPVQGTSGCL